MIMPLQMMMELLPEVTKNGIKVMSLNLLLEDQTDPVVWRGPIISGTVSQFWTEVCWGDVDYMFVDMPPGTGDVALTVFQSLPVDGIVVVYFSAGSGTNDRKESLQYGKYDEDSDPRRYRELQLSEMSGLWQRDQAVWRESH